MTTMKWGRATLITAAAVTGLLLPASTWAQGGFATGFASPDAMDAWNAQSVGAGTGQLALDRARGVAGGGGGFSDPWAQGGGGFADPYSFGGGGAFPPPGGGFGPADPYSSDPAMFGADPSMGFGFPGGGPMYAGGQPAFGAGVVATIPKVIAIYGERVICPVTKKILKDADEVPVFQTFVDSYYDDGQTGMDYKANDGVYTNVTLVTDQMDPEAHLVKTRLIRGLAILEELEPNFFFGVPVSSTDPLAGVPQVLDLEDARDVKLRQWAERFLNDFRVDPDAGAGSWKFHPTFLPPPPFPPLENLPANFRPAFASKEEKAEQERQQRLGVRPGQGQQGQGGLADRIGTSDIGANPAASSAYF
jgi:hypothetical protein